MTDSGEWDGVRRLLERAHRVVTPELPGFGTTPIVPGEVSLAEVVLAAVDGPAALVGTSFGGRAVLEAALAAPERVTHLVLINANVFGWGEGVQKVQSGEEELFEAGRFDDAADLMARSWLVGPERERDQVDAALYDRVCQMVLRGYKLQAEGGDTRCASRSSRRASRRRPSCSAARSTGPRSPRQRNVSPARSPTRARPSSTAALICRRSSVRTRSRT